MPLPRLTVPQTHRKGSRKAAGRKRPSNDPDGPEAATAAAADTLAVLDEEALKYAISVEEYFAKGMAEYARELGEVAARQAVLNAVQAQELDQREEGERLVGLARIPSWGLLGDVLAVQLRQQDLITRSCQTDWKWHGMAVRWRHARFIQTTIPPPLPPQTIIEFQQKTGTALSKTSHESVHDLFTSKSRYRRHKSMMKINHIPQHALTHRDKCVDTHDLEFDPYDPKMTYTPVFQEEKMFISTRCSTIIHRWRLKTKERVHHQQQTRQAVATTASKTSKEIDGEESASLQHANQQAGEENDAESQKRTSGGTGSTVWNQTESEAGSANDRRIVFTGAQVEENSEQGSEQLMMRFSEDMF